MGNIIGILEMFLLIHLPLSIIVFIVIAIIEIHENAFTLPTILKGVCQVVFWEIAPIIGMVSLFIQLILLIISIIAS